MKTDGFFLNLCLLRAKDAKLCLCNLGKEWPTASSVDHNGRLASFPQSQPLRRTLNANIPMKMLSWHYRCTFYAAKVYRSGCKCKKHCFIRLNLQYWCPLSPSKRITHNFTLLRKQIVHYAADDNSSHVTMCKTFDNHILLCFISNCRYIIYSLCAFL